MKIAWLDGTTTEWRVAYSPVVVYGLDGGIVSLLKSMPAGYTLNSRYSATGVNGTKEEITFKADGNFSDASGGKGRYKINGNTLTLTSDDGRSSHSVICLNTVAGKKYLVINNMPYLLQ